MIQFDLINRQPTNSIDDITVDYTDLNILPISLNFNVNSYNSDSFIKQKLASKSINIYNSFLGSYYTHSFYKNIDYFKKEYKNNKGKTKSSIKSVFDDLQYQIEVLQKNLVTRIVKNSTNISYLNKRMFEKTFLPVGNNIRILNRFKNGYDNGSYIRNSEKLIINYNYIYKKVDDGIYPVFMFGVDLNKINEFNYNYLNKAVYNKDYNFSSIRVYIDKDWYLDSCNKVLKIKLLNIITEYFDNNYELILFDGKEFANKNMHGYFEKNYPTLAKRKEYYQKIENKLYEFYSARNYKELDYIKIQNEILEKYNSYIIQEEKKEPETSILENESLSDEDLQSIFNLIGEIDNGGASAN